MIRRRFSLLFAFVLAVPVAFIGSPASAQVEEFSAYSAGSELAEAHADVFRLYWAFFDREPDVPGARYWVGQYDQCSSLLDITWSFSNSAEFRSRYGNLSHDQYIDLVYSNVLDRTPDAEGKAYWLSLLNSGELIQAEVMLYFSAGQEFKRLHPLPSDGRSYSGCTEPTPQPESVYYANCSAARAAGAAPVRRGDPGYRAGLDRDGDGIGCES